jgi:transposase
LANALASPHGEPGFPPASKLTGIQPGSSMKGARMQETRVKYDQADDNARELIRRTKRATRRRFTPEEKVRIVVEGIRGEIPISVLCRREGLTASTYYKLLKDFMEAGKARLKGDTERKADKAEVDGLRRENERLKELVAELAVENLVLKKSLG